MNKQATITIAVLTLGTIGAFTFFFTAVRDAAERASLGLTRSAAAPSPTPQFSDVDADGLPDKEEALWGTDYQNPDTDGDGFKDGEETVSGRDPLIPGPDDALPYQGQGNVTERTTNLVLGALASGATTESGDITDEAANAIVDDILLQVQLNIPPITPHSLRTTPSTPAIIEAYAKAISPILKIIAEENPTIYERFLVAVADAEDGGQGLTRFAATDLSTLDAQITKLESIIVPSTYLQGHDKLLTLLKQVRQYYASGEKMIADPLQYIVAASSITRITLIDIPDALALFSSIYKKQ
ncbi:MAG: hypothetical protein AAB608_02915 [Patescibacteria group bacterium]